MRSNAGNVQKGCLDALVAMRIIRNLLATTVELDATSIIIIARLVKGVLPTVCPVSTTRPNTGQSVCSAREICTMTSH